MRKSCFAAGVMLACLAVTAWSADAPALDAAKYPQDTPQNTLNSVIKAMEGKDFAYWVTWLVIPADKERLLTKYKTVDAIVEVNAQPKRAEKVAAQCVIMKNLLKESKTSEGDENGVKWYRFQGNDKVLLQLEKQADGRWCMNNRVTGDSKGEAPKGEEKAVADPPKK